MPLEVSPPAEPVLPAEPAMLTADEIERALADVARLRRNASNGYISNPSEVLTCLKQVQGILTRVEQDRTTLLIRLGEVVGKHLEARAESTRLLRDATRVNGILAEVRASLVPDDEGNPFVSLPERCADMRDEITRLRGLADSTAALGLSDEARAALLAVEQEIRAAYKAREIEIVRKADEDVEAEENETCKWRGLVKQALAVLDQAKEDRATHTGHVERMYDKGAAALDVELRPLLKTFYCDNCNSEFPIRDAEPATPNRWYCKACHREHGAVEPAPRCQKCTFLLDDEGRCACDPDVAPPHPEV